MRQTLQDAAKSLLTEPVGTERQIVINTNDGLTGFPPGMSGRGFRTKTMSVVVEHQTRDGKVRPIVKETGKGVVVATGAWTTAT